MKKTFLLLWACLLLANYATAQVVLDQKTNTQVSTIKSDAEGVDSIITYATTVTKTIEHVRDSIVIDTMQTVLHRTDSIRVNRPAITIADSTRRGHYFQVFIGAGYGQVLQGASRNPQSQPYEVAMKGHAAGVFQAQYAYFFHENIGVSVGLGLSSYGGYADVNGIDSLHPKHQWMSVTNDLGDYRMYRKVNNWRDNQRMWMVDLPIQLQFQGLINPKFGLYGGVGVTVSYAFSNKWWLSSGEVWDMEEFRAANIYSATDQNPDLVGVWDMRNHTTYAKLGDQEFTAPIPYSTGGMYPQKLGGVAPWKKDERKDMNTKNLQVGLLADFGFIIPLDYQNELLIGLYARYNVLDTRNTKEPVELGFDHEKIGYEGIRSNFGNSWLPSQQITNEFNNYWDYHVNKEEKYSEDGIAGTTATKYIRPWQVGLKIGYQWRFVRRTKVVPVEYRHFQVADTTYNYRTRTQKLVSYTTETETTYAYDTIMSPVDEIRRLMEKAIIWYDFDSYVPKLDPVDVLDNIAQILVQYPNLKVEVNGHTCTIGRRAYNQKLSERRAKAVADLLIALGVHPSQLIIQGFCSDKPYFSESHQLYLDRRCEIVPIEETNEQHLIHKETRGANASTETITK